MEKGNPPTLLVGMQVGTATLENSVEVLRKLKIELPCDPAIALLGVYPKDTDSEEKGHMHPNVHSSIVRNS